MSALPNVRRVSLEEFERLPDFDGVQELLDGEVVEIPPPKRRHSQIVRAIETIFLRHLDRSRVWLETGFLIGDHCPQPDLAVIHSGQGLDRGWYAGAPLIAVGVASRGNTPDELEFKKELYLAHGAHEVWIVHDKTRTVEWFSRTGENQTHRTSFYCAPLGAEVDLREVFSES
jgi:Uma2 family endonuclease